MSLSTCFHSFIILLYFFFYYIDLCHVSWTVCQFHDKKKECLRKYVSGHFLQVLSLFTNVLINDCFREIQVFSENNLAKHTWAECQLLCKFISYPYIVPFLDSLDMKSHIEKGNLMSIINIIKTVPSQMSPMWNLHWCISSIFRLCWHSMTLLAYMTHVLNTLRI